MTLENLLQDMWVDYVSFNPGAKAIYDLLMKQGETVENDHVAFRTFNIPKVGIEQLAKPFLKFGYQPKGEYQFVQKKLFARHYEHTNPQMPKIFISELLLEKCSPELQKIANELVAGVPLSVIENPRFLCSGRPWNLKVATYDQLAKESEYASWLAAFGYRPNHFTVNINTLKSFPQIDQLNQFLQSHGVRLNSSGGLVKGTPKELLEQSSTMANPVKVDFADGSREVPACYYEFAKRYPMANGELYQGFLEKSADKIFESTNRV